MARNTKARVVLAILEDTIDETNWSDLVVEPYLNGRENGFAVHNWKKGMRKVAFSENRNSDDIVVYLGKIEDFSMQGNTPSEHCYKHAKYLKYDAYLEAAKMITKHLFEEK